jgi:YfiH family protein
MLQRRVSTDGSIPYYASPLLEAAGVPHGFSTRIGGVSPVPFDSLNLGISRDSALKDDRANILENYRRFANACGCANRERCWVSQVHGGEVADATTACAAFECGVPADALVTDDPRRVVSVKYADCVPVLLATADGRKVAAVHAGWRGVVAGIVPTTVGRLTIAERPNLLAAIGPCISFEAFEVGPEVLDAFVRLLGPDAPIRRRDDGKGHVDLRRAVRRQLIDCGLVAQRIDETDRCTFRDAGDFYSHRRGGPSTGRMAALISPAR